MHDKKQCHQTISSSLGGIRLLALWLSMLAMLAAVVFKAKAEEIPAELQALTFEALTKNQELASLADKVAATYTEAPAAGTLPDPMVGFSLANLPTDSFSFDQEAMTQKQVSVSQKLPWFGTLDLAEEKVQLNAVSLEHKLAARKNAIANELSQLWYDLLFVDHNLDLNAKLTQIIHQTLKVAETRYGTGTGLQQDILSAQVQLSELMEEDTVLRGRQKVLGAQIAALLNRPSSYEAERQELSMPADLMLDREVLTLRALDNNPGLLARRTMVDIAGTAVKLAEKDYLPGMDFRASYGQRDDNPKTGEDRADLFSVGVAFSVPIWQGRKQDSKLAAAKKRLTAAENAVADLEQQLEHQVDAILSDIASYRENHRLLSEVLALQAEQLADSSMAAYSVGKLEFDTMLAAQVKLLKIRLKGDRYLFETRKKLAKMREVVGIPVIYNEGQK